MDILLGGLKAAKIEWLLQLKKRLNTLTRDFRAVFYTVYPTVHQTDGIRGVLRTLQIIEDIESQIGALRVNIRAMLSPCELDSLHRDCRGRCSDAYNRAIETAVLRLKAEIRAEAALPPRRQKANPKAKAPRLTSRKTGQASTAKELRAA